MRTWLFVGSLAAGILLFVYELYARREQEQRENAYGGGSGPAAPMSDEDFIEINETIPKEVKRQLEAKKIPGPEDTCSICLENLVRLGETGRYCIIALPKCGHWFHQKCAFRLLQYHPMCPVCRNPIDASMLKSTPVRVIQPVEDQASTSDSTNACSGDVNQQNGTQYSSATRSDESDLRQRNIL